MFQKELVALRMTAELRRSLGVARGATATLGTSMKFFEDSAHARIGLPSIVRAGIVNKFVAMVVHLDFALRTNHIVSISHSKPSSAFQISPKLSVRALGAVSLPSR